MYLLWERAGEGQEEEESVEPDVVLKLPNCEIITQAEI